MEVVVEHERPDVVPDHGDAASDQVPVELEESEVDEPAAAAEAHDGGDDLEGRRQRVAVEDVAEQGARLRDKQRGEASSAGAMAATLSRAWTPMIVSSQRRRQTPFLATSSSVGRARTTWYACGAVALALRTSNTRTTLLLDLMVSRIMEI